MKDRTLLKSNAAVLGTANRMNAPVIGVSVETRDGDKFHASRKLPACQQTSRVVAIASR